MGNNVTWKNYHKWAFSYGGLHRESWAVFRRFLTCIREGISGLHCEHDSNRVSSLLCRLTHYERILGLISSRVGERGKFDELLADLERLLTTVRHLKSRYQVRHNEMNTYGDTEEAHMQQNTCFTEDLGHAWCPRLVVDKDVVKQLRDESLKWVDIARILGISTKTLIRRRKEFEMPIGADAFTCMEDRDLDKHVRDILQLNPDAGTFNLYKTNFQ